MNLTQIEKYWAASVIAMILIGVMSENEYKFIAIVFWILVSAAVRQIIENKESQFEKRSSKVSVWSLSVDFGTLIFAVGYFIPTFWIFWIAGTILMILGIPIYFVFGHRDRN